MSLDQYLKYQTFPSDRHLLKSKCMASHSGNIYHRQCLTIFHNFVSLYIPVNIIILDFKRNGNRIFRATLTLDAFQLYVAMIKFNGFDQIITSHSGFPLSV